MQKSSFNKAYSFSLVFLLLIMLAALGAIVRIGTTSRYMADDYCYAAILQGGFWERQLNAYLHETAFSGNRFSLTLFTGVSELFGPKFIRVLPGLMLSAWLAGLFLFLRRLSFFNGRSWLNRLEAAVVSAALVVFTLGMAPNWVQVFFWRAGMFPYLAPVVFGCWLMYLVAASLQTSKARRFWRIAVLLTAFLTGGFSEAGVTAEVSILAICLLVMMVRREKMEKCLSILFALAGSLAALGLIIFSPMNLLRLQTSYGQSASLLTTLVDSFKGAVTFYLATLYRPTLYFLSALLLFTFIGWSVASRTPERALPVRRALVWMVGAAVSAFLVTMAAMAPGFFAESSYPSDRAIFVPRFVSLLLACVLGSLTGSLLAGWKKNVIKSIVLLFFGVAAVFIPVMWLGGMRIQFHPPAYPDMRMLLQQNPWLGIVTLLVSASILGLLFFKKGAAKTIPLLIVILSIPAALIGTRFMVEYPLMKNRADLWDGRDALIRQLQADGEFQLVVPAMNSLAGILELSDQKGFWVNNCAAYYYKVDSISAVEPVLDPVQLSNP